jgi:hypothetical protein
MWWIIITQISVNQFIVIFYTLKIKHERDYFFERGKS